VHYGVHLRLTADSPDIREIATWVQDAGLESLWLPEHTHMPTAVMPTVDGAAQVLIEQSKLLDPWVALAAAAASAPELNLGVAVALLALHDPIVFAKTVASLDVIASGRILVGVGAGSHPHEAVAHGIDPQRRWTVLLDKLQAVKQLWTQEVASVDLPSVRFSGVRQEPKPVQRPHPPLLLGGAGGRVIAHVLQDADGWIPHAHDALPTRAEGMLARAAERGLTRSVTAFAAPLDRDVLDRYGAAGIERCVFSLPSAPVDAVRQGLEDVITTLG
jgi:probable F420-dependent oxidoreductase